MEDTNLYIAAVLLEKRTTEAPDVQKVFTKYGQYILSRLGIHESDDLNGFISLNMRASEDTIRKFEDELTSIEGVNVKYMKVK
jgi:hypothetical protein